MIDLGALSDSKLVITEDEGAISTSALKSTEGVTVELDLLLQAADC